MRQKSIYLPHGGGPCFFMDPPPDEPTRWVALETYLRNLPRMLPGRPSALLVISAHWETQRPTFLCHQAPDLLFDYSGFPPHTYRLTYPAPCAVGLVDRARRLAAEAGFESDVDTQRGYDHGVFVPLKVIFPEADIPILQLSLQRDLDPQFHIRLGHALAPLREENVLVIGSGLSFHNLRALNDARFNAPAKQFDDWLTGILCDGPIAERETRLSAWDLAPAARLCHPEEEHLLPLMVAVGAAAGDRGEHAFSGTIWQKAISAFHFG